MIYLKLLLFDHHREKRGTGGLIAMHLHCPLICGKTGRRGKERKKNTTLYATLQNCTTSTERERVCLVLYRSYSPARFRRCAALHAPRWRRVTLKLRMPLAPMHYESMAGDTNGYITKMTIAIAINNSCFYWIRGEYVSARFTLCF